ncbi:MAG: hypothetical protein IJQ93_11615 [Bacteroidales bacterium]|nr:hypothetical protein [Bacteroidales bacterium]
MVYFDILLQHLERGERRRGAGSGFPGLFRKTRKNGNPVIVHTLPPSPRKSPIIRFGQRTATRERCAPDSANGLPVEHYFRNALHLAKNKLQPLGSGHVASSALGWNRVYIYTIAFGVIGSLIIALIWRVPADGYDKVNIIIADNPDL